MNPEDYEHIRIWCRECGDPMRCHLPDCPVINNLEDNNE
jgi:hypothetical protein